MLQVIMRKETIRIQGLSIGYADRHETKIVAKNIDASVNSGELTCLLGPNGAGKSTLLRTISSFLPRLSGNISIDGRDIATYSDKELAYMISVVLTEKPDIRNMSVVELVGLGRSPYTGFWGVLDTSDKTIVNQSLELVGIAELSHRMIQTLSDGERQKVMIAKALAQQTPVILLDEPTAFLDYPSKVDMMQLLFRLSRETGKTIFLSTHDLELALQIADRIWLMDKKLGMRIGTPEDLSLDGSLSDYFARGGVEFDVMSGLFRVSATLTMRIAVKGSDARCAMVCKALRRNGIMGCSDANTMLSIDAGNKRDDAFMLTIRDGSLSRSAASISELLDIVFDVLEEKK